MNERFRDMNQRDGCGCEDYGSGRGGQRRSRGDDHHSYGRSRGDDRRKELLLKIQQLNFLMIETGLFLNNQCDCEAAQVAFCDYQRRHAEAVAEYEECYGPLTYMGVNAKSDGWSWMNGPWPWEAEDC